MNEAAQVHCSVAVAQKRAQHLRGSSSCPPAISAIDFIKAIGLIAASMLFLRIFKGLLVVFNVFIEFAAVVGRLINANMEQFHNQDDRLGGG